ncbi:MAG: hypothetical protein WA228_08350, partial [Desulfobaccales bacterium]
MDKLLPGRIGLPGKEQQDWDVRLASGLTANKTIPVGREDRRFDDGGKNSRPPPEIGGSLGLEKIFAKEPPAAANAVLRAVQA